MIYFWIFSEIKFDISRKSKPLWFLREVKTFEKVVNHKFYHGTLRVTVFLNFELFTLFLVKLVVIRDGINKILVRIAMWKTLIRLGSLAG